MNSVKFHQLAGLKWWFSKWLVFRDYVNNGKALELFFFLEKKLLIENTYFFFQDIPRYQYCEKRQNKVEV